MEGHRSVNEISPKHTTILIIGILEILLGILLVLMLFSIEQDKNIILWGSVIGVVIIIVGTGILRMLEWARLISIFSFSIIFMAGLLYLFIMLGPLAQSDRIDGGGPGEIVIYITGLLLITTGFIGTRLLSKYKDKFRKS